MAAPFVEELVYRTLRAVDEVENLCSGLSRKVWQKIMILDRFEATARHPEARGEPHSAS